MFFSSNAREFEPLEKAQLDAMLEAWGKDLHEDVEVTIPLSSGLNARVGRRLLSGSTAQEAGLGQPWAA